LSYRFFLDLFSAHLFSYRFWLVYFGTSVLLLEVGILFSCFFFVIFRARVAGLQDCIVFAGFWRSTCFHSGDSYHFYLVFFQNTCSQATSLYRVRWYLSKHVLQFWKLGVPVFLLDVCTVYAGGFSGAPVLI
jgi:hypothetical protein